MTGRRQRHAKPENTMSAAKNPPQQSAPRSIPTQVTEKLAALDQKVQSLIDIDPYLIDLSLRENPFGSQIGQTLTEKLNILPQLRAFGFKNILLGTLDYAVEDEPEVDDDFMQYLKSNGIDMTGGFAFTAVGSLDDAGDFHPSLSMQKLANYGVPNTLHEIYIMDQGSDPNYFANLMASIPQSVAWLNANIVGDNGGKPRIIINIVDGFDCIATNPQRACEVFELLATLPIEGVSIEDDRGTYLPMQVGVYIDIVRSLLPSPMKILVHVHTGAGFENATVIEALLNGADGAWGGLPKRAAMIGHASLGELIANLVRVGNTNMNQYQLGSLLPFATTLQMVDEGQGEPIPEDSPILGSNAYRLTLSFFEQQAGRFMDLPPTQIGGTYGYRVCPIASNEPVLAGRLAEVTGQPASSFPIPVLTQMIRLMRRDLRAGIQTVYDEPTNLLALYRRAQA
jgi:hypothetical protein